MQSLIESLGGIGLFLFGMTAMTSGLRKLAGDRLRRSLARWTRNPFSGAVVGTAATAVLQSSSATTVAAVGFVAAGLMTFTEALGIIFGANIGTTLTGWMVALLGFKLKLSTIAQPLMFVAALCYLFKSNRMLRGFGKAFAGFCLIFMGIGLLQNGLAGLEGAIDLGSWHAESLSGRLLLVLAGGMLTVITQSSSVTVAAAITALNTSILTLPQAAAVIIGADIGTTLTAALATVGATTAARRTGFAHVIYNVLTGAMAFSILPLYLWLLNRYIPDFVSNMPEVVAVGFHSFFNILGVALVLPFTKPFGRFIEFLIPEKTPPLSAPFDKSLLQDPRAATDSLINGVRVLAQTGLRAASAVLKSSSVHGGKDALCNAVDSARSFAVQIGAGGEKEGDGVATRIFNCLHLVDHIERLVDRTSDTARGRTAREHPTLASLSSRTAELTTTLAEELCGQLGKETVQKLEKMAVDMESDRFHFRSRILKRAVAGELSADELADALDAHRWLRRINYHAWRIANYAAELEKAS
jgi:phosphate:Na+ symporter